MANNNGNPLFNLMSGMMENNSNPLSALMGGGGGNMNMQQMMMGMLQKQNPQAFQQINQMMQSGQDPKALVQKQLSGMNPQQINQLKQQASQFGISESTLNDLIKQ